MASGNCWQLHASCQIYKVGSGMIWTVATATAPAAVPHLFAWHFLAKTDNLLVPHVRCAKFHGNRNIYYNHNASNWHQMCKGKSCRAAAFMRTSPWCRNRNRSGPKHRTPCPAHRYAYAHQHIHTHAQHLRFVVGVTSMERCPAGTLRLLILLLLHLL